MELGNGVEGLLHISEYDHVRIFKLDRVVKPGDKVQVQVIKIDNEHVGLSRKALIPNFWQEYTESKEVGQVINGKVIEINNAGLVMELSPEVTGFLPKVNLPMNAMFTLVIRLMLATKLMLKLLKLILINVVLSYLKTINR